MAERNITIASNHFRGSVDSNMAASTSPKSIPEIITRTTKGGRKLRYTLTVIQQPERARACGSGAKSSADRRPVDPPPVVQLRIHDETEPRQEKEITFHYNANFFLFATLEVARPIAQGRVQTSAPQAPVLTGMPVSGMAYLDRPNEAGYFIFPDLSVRHEGQYKLSFNLYEETKEEKDVDIEPSNDSSMRKMSSAAAAAESSFDWRMELKSDQFTVYSAKKFPGLSESTDLSRTVAEQGCRVRIRRDVRMRRRDTKPGGDFGENEDEYQQGRATSPTFDYAIQAARQRALSTSGNEDPQQRRGSGEISPYRSPAAGSPYRTPSLSPSTSNAPLPAGGQLHWMAQGSGYAPVQAIQPPPPPPPPPPPSSSYSQPISVAYPNQGPSTPFRQQALQGPPPPPPGSYSGFEERQSFSQFRPPANPPQPQSYDPDYRRMSFAYQMSNASQGSQPTTPAVQNSTYSQQSMEPTYSRNPSSAYSNSYQDSVALAPLRAEQPTAMSPLAPVTSMIRGPPSLAPMPSIGLSNNYNKLERSGSYSQYPPIEAEPPRSANKRSYSDVFITPSESLYNGRRPSAISQREEDEEEQRFRDQMTYRRANGSFQRKPAPNLN
ncbi:hypothetical protein SS1G_07626 [Sclerotinia sclerotiorum 1980 UF-70]|uniref:Velvet domain-containing protein n=2 Tax=Sclerotinia sclerotiorum (strain ATCC 18683 / 1980 / Ss-1) TaxID=665079 RepID=A7EQM4_SCLS1|nr:hypothetical protein SS1G_07626 [Sclerotinia sclerotiorum 1980 UF-70]APA13693.1 hypothetical protein sscle_11g084630 [Sclerotinia sclerotiorum 1980 UF-70]EDN91766.1 hypothetical protein SS1G_07626 [Sclerotinia sclerotiorum 1980 UF-70]